MKLIIFKGWVHLDIVFSCLRSSKWHFRGYSIISSTSGLKILVRHVLDPDFFCLWFGHWKDFWGSSEMPGKRHLGFGFLCDELLPQILGSFSGRQMGFTHHCREHNGAKHLPWIYPSVNRQSPEQAKRTNKHSHLRASLKKASENLPFSEDTQAGSASMALSCSSWGLFSHFLKRFFLRDV